MELEESAEALEGLGSAAWWLDEIDKVFVARERAYRLYRAGEDPRGAGRIATALTMDYVWFKAQPAIADGWLQRAHRLLDGEDPIPEQGLLALLEGLIAIIAEHDPVAARKYAAQAIEIGRSLGIFDIEMLGLALEGLALVSEGQVEEGMRQLDEATAAATSGEMEDPVAIGFACCYLLFACERARDYDRAAQWCERIKEHCERVGFQALLSICHAHYANVLMYRGIWEEAETEAISATDDLTANRPGIAAESLVRLAELRRRQGRLQEAFEVFRQMEFHPLAQLGLGNLALDRGEPEAARDRAERFLRQVPEENRTERAAGNELLVRACSALGEHQRAREALDDLKSLASLIETPLIRASAHAAQGLLADTEVNLDAARRHFEDALSLYQQAGLPYEAAQTRLGLARVLFRAGRTKGAEDEIASASETFQELGATSQSDAAAAALSEVRAELSSSNVETLGILTEREVEVLRLVADGRTDTEIAERLTISEHTVHRHVANIRHKLAVATRSAAVAEAARQGLL